MSFAFSISPMCRNFDTYYHILKRIDSTLLEIPWARTGVSLLNNSIDADKSHTRDYHNYSTWFLDDYYSDSRNVLFDGQLVKHNIIDKLGLKQLFTNWKKDANLSELVSKLYQVELFISHYNLELETQEYLISSRLKNSINMVLRNKFGRIH